MNKKRIIRQTDKRRCSCFNEERHWCTDSKKDAERTERKAESMKASMWL